MRWTLLLPLVLDLASYHSAAVREETSDPFYCSTRKSSEALFPCEDTNTKLHSCLEINTSLNIVVNNIPSAQCLLSPQAHKSQSSWEFQQYSGRYESSALQRNIQCGYLSNFDHLSKFHMTVKWVYTNYNNSLIFTISVWSVC